MPDPEPPAPIEIVPPLMNPPIVNPIGGGS
jgi:hypothetical protein